MYNKQVQYRIRANKKTEDDFDQQIQQQLKLSTHIKQPSKQLSKNQFRKTQNSRLKDSRTGNGTQNSLAGSRVGRILKSNKSDKNAITDIQFNNVRWISIVSAYDAKRLKHVTVSKKSCESFLKRYGYNIKKDPTANAILKDITKHFHSWLAKVNKKFAQVLDHFLKTSHKPLQTFQDVQPILEEVSFDTSMMKEKLEGCLRINENNDFRKLLNRFQSFYSFSQGLQKLIGQIYQIKERIDQAFAEIEQEPEMVDRKVQKIKKQGLKHAEHIIFHQRQTNPTLCQRIVEKVAGAIGNLAANNLNVFHKIQGAKQLLIRLKNLLHESHKQISISEIKKMSKIFKQIIQQANKYEDFANSFDTEGQYVSNELREKINIYRENLQEKKRAVSEIQVIFVSTVINQTMLTLKNNFTLNNALKQKKNIYNEHNHMLEEIANAMLNQTRRASVQGLIKHGKTNFTRLQEEYDKIKRILRQNEDGLVIDTQDGKIAVLQYCKFAEQYKNKIRNLLKKHDQALKSLQINNYDVRLPSNDRDEQLLYLKGLNSLVQIINGRQRKIALSTQRSFLDLKQSILTLSKQVQNAYPLIQELNTNNNQLVFINLKNPIKNLIKNITIENNIYNQSSFILQYYKITSEVNEKNIIQYLNKITQLNHKRKHELDKNDDYKVTKAHNNLLERIYCLVLVKGLKKEVIKQLDQQNSIIFPENQFQNKKIQNNIKYYHLIEEAIGQGGAFIKNKIKNGLKIMKDMVKGFKIIQKLQISQKGQYFVLVQMIGQFMLRFFQICVSPQDLSQKNLQIKRICSQCIKLFKNKMSNLSILDSQIDMQTLSAALKPKTQMLKVQHLNQNTLKIIEQIGNDKKGQFFDIYSKFAHSLAQYVWESHQIAYLALNQFKQPIWVGPANKAKDGIISLVGLKGYTRGTFIDKYVREPPQTKKIKQQKKQSKKQIPASSSPKKAPQEQMDQDIEEQNDQMFQQFQQNIENQMEQQEINDQQIQQMQDQIGDQMDNQISEGPMEEDFEQETIKKQKAKPNTILKQLPLKIVQKAIEKKEEIEQKLVTVYEVIPNFKSLEEIRSLFLDINRTQIEYWSTQVDFDEIEDYYHKSNNESKEGQNFIKSLQSSFSLFLNTKFGKKIGDDIQKIQKFTNLKIKFNNLSQKEWNSLFNILNLIDFSYSLLVQKNQQRQTNLFVNIVGRGQDNFKRTGGKNILAIYLQKKFTSKFYNMEEFQLDQYFNYCFKIDTQEILNNDGAGFHHIIKVIPKYSLCLPTQQTHDYFISFQEVQNEYIQKNQTGIDIKNLLLQLWLKAINSQQQHYKPKYNILNNYIDTLSTIQKKQWIGHYLKQQRKRFLLLKNNIKNHKNTIDNILFKIDQTNIYQSILQLKKLYQKIILQQFYLNKSLNIHHHHQQQQQKLLFFNINQETSYPIQNQICKIINNFYIKHLKKQNKIILEEKKIIQYFQKNNKIQKYLLKNLAQFLNILEIDHFYNYEEQLIIKYTQDQLILFKLKNLNITNKSQFKYQQIIKDLFIIKNNKFSTQISLGQHINPVILTKQYIQIIQQSLQQKQTQFKNNQKQFQNLLIVKKQISSVLFDFLIGQKSNNIVQGIQKYLLWFQKVEKQFKNQFKNKVNNPLLYIYQKQNKIQKLQQNIMKNYEQIKKFGLKNRNNKDSLAIITWASQLMNNILVWSKAKEIVTQATVYKIVSDIQTWTIGLQFTKPNAYDFISKTIFKYWIQNSDKTKFQWQQIYQNFFTNYLQQNIQTTSNNNITTININIKKLIKMIIKLIREDIISAQQLYNFSRLYNKNKFNSSQSQIKIKMEEHGKHIVKSIKKKLQLVEIKEFVGSCNWKGLQGLSSFNQLLQCLKTQFDINKLQLDSILAKTSSIIEKDKSLSQYLEWYKAFCVDLMKMQYYNLKSSKGQQITILPVVKIQKDKVKSTQQIKKLLEDIQITSLYHLKLEQGVPNICLEKQFIHCCLVDKDGALKTEDSLKNYEPQVAEGQILIIHFSQLIKGEPAMIHASKLQLKNTFMINISQQSTTCSISGGISKILKSDYEQFIGKYQQPSEQDYKSLKKKIRGLASPQEKFKNVRIGQNVSLNIIGNWLHEQIKKYQKKIQQVKRIEEEKRKLAELILRQSQTFLEAIYTQMTTNQCLPTIKINLKEIQQYRQQKGQYQSYNNQLNGYWKKILDTNKKIIQKLQQNKSRQDISKLGTLPKDFLKILQQKLHKNTSIEVRILSKASLKYTQIKISKQKQKQKQRVQNLKKKVGNIVKKNQAGDTLNINPVQNIPISQQQSIKQEEEMFDASQLILECDEIYQVSKGIEEEMYMSYLIDLLERATPKAIDYNKCILAQFWKLPKEQRTALTLLK